MANIDVGKTIAVTRLSDGSVLSMFNHAILSTSESVSFKDVDGRERYEMQIDQKAISERYRCAYFMRSLPQQSIKDATPNLLIMKTSDSDSKTAKPLYEFITPSIMSVQQDMVQLSWWSNVDANKFDGKYDPDVLIRFSSNNLVLDTTVPSIKILCTATIRWEYLKQSGGGVQDEYFKLFPVIELPSIATSISGGYVVDFDSGGGGNGIGIHTHISNDDGGFAAAVFMPSANMRPFNWR